MPTKKSNTPWINRIAEPEAELSMEHQCQQQFGGTWSATDNQIAYTGRYENVTLANALVKKFFEKFNIPHTLTLADKEAIITVNASPSVLLECALWASESKGHPTILAYVTNEKSIEPRAKPASRGRG